MANTTGSLKRDNGNTPQASTKSTTPFKWNYCLIAFILPFILYIFSIKNGYNLDDSLVTQNQKLTQQGISAIPEIFKSNYYSDNMGYAYEYRPVVLSSFAIEHQFFGDNPFVSHFINVLLYSFLCFLLYRCLRRFFKNTNYLFSLLITLVFAFHPMHTEVVCSIKNRDELLSMIFALLAFRFAMLYADKKTNYWNLVIMAGFFLLGLLSKKTALIFGAVIPVFLLLYSGQILIALISGVILYISAAIINPGMILHDWHLFFLIVPFFLAPYLLLGLKNTSSRQAFLKSFYDLSGTIVINESVGGENAVTLKSNAPDSLFLWAISIANLAVFGALFYFNLMLLTIPALVAIYLFITARSKGMQLFNLLAFTATTGLLTFRFLDQFIYLLAISIIGVLYFYNIHAMRKLILAAGAIILASAAQKIGQTGPALILLALVVLYTRFNNRWLSLVYLIIGVFIGWKLFFVHGRFEFINASNSVYKTRFIFCFLIIGFLLMPQKLKFTYAPVIILAFAMMLLFRINGMTEKSNIKNAAVVTNKSFIEPTNTSRPLTFSEAPVNNQSPLRIRLGTSAEIALKYLKMAIVPWPMSFYYGYRCIEPTDIFTVWPILGIAIYMLLTLFAFIMLQKSKSLFSGIFLFVLGVIAVSDFFYPMPGMMADRFLFVPSLGFAITVVAGLSLLFKTDWTKFSLSPGNLPVPIKGLLLTMFVFYGYLTIARTADWKDMITLFRHDINYVEESCQAHNLLATNLVIYSFNVQNTDSQRVLRNEALFHFKKAISIYPNFMNIAYDAGRTYTLLNEDDSALVYYKMANALIDSFPDANNNIGQIFMRKGLFAQAIPYFERVIKYEPGNQYPYSQLGLAFFSLKRYRESITITELSIQRFPSDIGSYVNAGKIFGAMGNKDSSLIFYRQAYVMSNGDARLKAEIEELEKK